MRGGVMLEGTYTETTPCVTDRSVQMVVIGVIACAIGIPVALVDPVVPDRRLDAGRTTSTRSTTSC